MSAVFDRIKDLVVPVNTRQYRKYYACCSKYDVVDQHTCAYREQYLKALKREMDGERRNAEQVRNDFLLTAPLAVAYNFFPKVRRKTKPL